MASLTCGQGTQMKTYLLDLPVEILQLIAWHMDVATFYTSLLTCKKFMDAAKARRIILRHVQHLPGLRLGFEHMSTLQLWDLFRKRAAESLCGAGVLADIKSYAPTQSGVRSHPQGSRPGEQPKRKYRCDAGSNGYKVSKPAFSLALPAQVAMADDLGVIRVFKLDDRGIRLSSELHPQPLNFSDPCDVAVLKMAFSSGNDLAILYQPLEPTKVLEPSPFYQRANPVPLMVVVYRPRLSPSGDISYSVEEHELTEIPCHTGTECVSLAVAPNRNVCVGWRGHNLLERTDFWLIVSSSRKPPKDSDSNIIVLRDPTATRISSSENQLVFHSKFIRGGKGLNFYEAGNPIHSWFISCCDGTENESNLWHSRNNICFTEIDGQVEKFEIGMPFRGFHRAIVADGTPFCRYSYIAMGITKTTSPPSAFILVTEFAVPTPICEHSLDLDGARNGIEWKIVAFLAGWRRGGSSLGTVMAVSPGGNRIAAATWDRLLIWTLDAELLHQGELQHYFPERDYNATKGFGRLRPTKLSTEGIGVIYDLRWASETSLFASTELGLVQWDMGILSTGERQSLSLDQEA